MKYIENISVIILLVICSITDLKNKTIYKKLCIVFVVLGMGIKIIECVIVGDNWLIKILYGMLPGLIIYMISWGTREGIGKGDAIVFMCIGELLGAIKCSEIFLVALICTMIISVPMVIIKRKSIKVSVPFMPFVMVAYILLSIV